MVVYTGFKATLKRVPRELYAMLLYIMIEFRSVPLSLRHEHQITTSNQSSFHFKIFADQVKSCAISTSNFNESCCYRYLPYRCSWPCYKCLSMLPECARLNDSHCLQH